MSTTERMELLMTGNACLGQWRSQRPAQTKPSTLGMDRGAQLEALSEGRPIGRESRVAIVKYMGYYKEILYNISIREITSLANNLAGAN